MFLVQFTVPPSQSLGGRGTAQALAPGGRLLLVANLANVDGPKPAFWCRVLQAIARTLLDTEAIHDPGTKP